MLKKLILFALMIVALMAPIPADAVPCPPGSFCTLQCANEEELCVQNCAHLLHRYNWDEYAYITCQGHCELVAFYCSLGCQSQCGPQQISNPLPDFALPPDSCSI